MLRQSDGDSVNKSNSSSKDKDYLIKIINHKARKVTKILARRENVPNAASGEAIPLRNVQLKNRLRKLKKRTWLQLAIMDLQEG